MISVHRHVITHTHLNSLRPSTIRLYAKALWLASADLRLSIIACEHRAVRRKRDSTDGTGSRKGQKRRMESNLLGGTFEFVHVALEERKVREEEVLELGVLFLIGREQKDDTDGDLLLPGDAQTRPAVLIRHVEALLHRPAMQISYKGKLAVPEPNSEPSSVSRLTLMIPQYLLLFLIC